MSNIYLTAWIRGPFFHIEPRVKAAVVGSIPAQVSVFTCAVHLRSPVIWDRVEVCECVSEQCVWVNSVCVSEQCVCPVIGWWPVITDWLIHCLYISISNSQETESGIWRHFLKYLIWVLKLQFEIFVVRSQSPQLASSSSLQLVLTTQQRHTLWSAAATRPRKQSSINI